MAGVGEEISFPIPIKEGKVGKDNWVLRTENLTKIFKGVAANDNINIKIATHEILSIVGENGAGKSTFCKMLTGIYKPDGGKIFLDNKEVSYKRPIDALYSGVSMVYQERNLIGMLTGAQNISLGFESTKGRLINDRIALARAEEIKAKLGINVPLDVPVETLGAGEQQLIEILRAFYNNPRILILDEPTASLGAGEIEPFLDFIVKLKREMEIAVIFISHKIEEVFKISDRIAVFTDGVCQFSKDISETSQSECINAMLRSDKIDSIDVLKRDISKNETVLSVTSAFYDNRAHELPFTIKRGEAVGFYGLVGSGRTECFEMIYGLRKASNKEVVFSGEKIGNKSTHDMIQKGMIMTPEKRAHGMYRALSIKDNICNLFLEDRLSNRMGFIDFKKAEKLSDLVLKKNNVKYRSSSQAINELSGGNIQKIIIGRSVEIDDIKLLVLDEPTTGMDIGAKHEVYATIRGLVENNNIGVAFISSELDELMSVCDRLYVFANGNIVDVFEREKMDKHIILETAVRGRRIV